MNNKDDSNVLSNVDNILAIDSGAETMPIPRTPSWLAADVRNLDASERSTLLEIITREIDFSKKGNATWI